MTVACGDADWYMVGVNLAEGELRRDFFLFSPGAAITRVGPAG